MSVSLIITVVLACNILGLILFKIKSKALQATLIITTVVVTALAAGYFYSKLERLKYNAHYGLQSKALIEATIEQLEKGNTQKVIEELKTLKKNYHPTYESQANYEQLTKTTVLKLKQLGVNSGPAASGKENSQ